MSHTGLRTVIPVIIIAASCLVPIVVSAPTHASDTPEIALAYESSGWSYQQVAYGGNPGFEQSSFDASSWPVGQAGFGTTDGTCSWNNSEQVHTSWTSGTDMLLRHQLTIPAGATNVHISGTVDNNAQIYVNGSLVTSTESGDCGSGAIDADIPSADIGSTNLLAIRATDLGEADYIDVQVTYDTPVSVVTSPSYTSVEYIQGFSLTGCVSDLVQHGVYGFLPPPAAAELLCVALHQSKNSAPPNHLGPSNIAGFAATKEYRGLMMVPSYQLSCSSAGQVLSVSVAGDSPFYASLGYTKVSIAGFEFHPGESYNPQDPTFDTGAPTIVTDPDGAVTISYRWASRIATTEREAQYYISGYDAPFIWLTFDEKISCDGQQAARFSYTNFPSTDIYINGSEVSHDKESNSFAHFIRQGGTKLHAAGHGNLAFPCRVKQFDNGNPSPVVSYSACQNNQLPPGAGTGGGGNL